MTKYHLFQRLHKIVGQSNNIIHMKMPHKLWSKFKAAYGLEELRHIERRQIYFPGHPGKKRWRGLGGMPHCMFWKLLSVLEKRTNAKGNFKSQVLLQRQKTDDYKKDNQVQFKRVERMERKCVFISCKSLSLIQWFLFPHECWSQETRSWARSDLFPLNIPKHKQKPRKSSSNNFFLLLFVVKSEMLALV